MPDKHWCLKSCELFQRLSSEQLARIESRSRARAFPARSPVYLPAEQGDHVFLLAKGLVKVCHLTADGKESVLGFVEPGELFGELAVFDAAQREEYVETVERSMIVMIPVEAMHHLMKERADFVYGLSKLVGLRRYRIERRLKNLLFLSNRERLVHLLLDLAEQFGEEKHGTIELRIRLSHQELASLIGSTRETVTVILGQLKAQGNFAGGRRKLVLTDPVRLAQSVGRQTPHQSGPDLKREEHSWSITKSPAIE